MHYFIIKIPNKREPHQIAFNHSPDIEFQMMVIKIIITKCLKNYLMKDLMEEKN